MSEIDGGELVARALEAEGIDCIFTLTGGHIMNIYTACAAHGIKVIDTRHEQAAGHAAEGWARIRRRPGVAVVTAGPGVTDVVTAVANAYHNRSPMLVIGGASALSQLGMGALQEMEQVDLMNPITKWAGACYQTARIPEYLAMCFRTAMTGRYGPCFLELPIDVLFGKVEEAFAPMRERYRPTGRVAGDPALVSEAASLLAKAERPVVVAGSEVYWSGAHEQLRLLIERLQAPVYLNSMARGCVRRDHPLFFSRTRRAALAEADAVLILGVPLDFRLGYGRDIPEGCSVIQVDIDPAEIGRNRSYTVGIEGDVRLVLDALLAELGDKTAPPRQWVADLRHREQRIEEERRRWLESDAVPIHPLRLCNEMAAFVDDNTLVVGDGGDIVNLASQVLPINNPGQWFDPGPMGTLGVGTGFAIAAQITHPGKRVLMVNGDGSFGLNGFEFDTMVRYRLPIVSVVGNDRQWGQIAMAQLKAYGDRGVIGSLLADNARYDKVVEGLGGHGEFVVEPSQIRPALERALASGKPACVNVLTDPRPPGVTSAEPV